MARKFIINNKLLEDGKVLGIICKFDDNSIQYVKKEQFNKLFREAYCDNAKLSSDNRIISESHGIESLAITKDKRILYHGSKGGIVGTPQYNRSRPICDFGVGFYTGTMAQQAKGIVSSSSKGVFYIMYCDASEVSVYKFKDAITWALYVGIHRGYIDINQIPKFKHIYADINKHDIIVGEIADDRMQEIFPEFMEGVITDRVLNECLKSVRLGDQWVFKTQKACDKVRILAEQVITNKQMRLIQQNKSKMLSGIQSKIKNIKVMYRRQGKYIDEIMGEYK